MAKTKTCKCGCKQKAALEDGVIVNLAWFVSFDHAAKHGIKLANASKNRQISKAKANKNKARVKERKVHSIRKKEVRKRSEWLNQLQKLVNQYVLHVLEKDAPCCTCGTMNGIKYDAGHFLSRGSRPELRFELTNIHKQCSVQCNGFKSGARAEYNEFIIGKYGQDHYEWLLGPHKSLKDRFPHWTDIEKEIIRYRSLLRSNGIRPNA
jgi:hypothetical protein